MHVCMERTDEAWKSVFFMSFVLMTSLIMLVVLQQCETLTGNLQNVPFKAEASSSKQVWGKYSANLQRFRINF